MITFLAKRLIPDWEQVTKPAVRQAYGMFCGIVGVVLNILLCGGKLLAGAITGSIAITADALNNLSDAGSSVVSLLGFRLAGQKPDSDHPFGHGRIEYISGLVVSMLILLMGAELLKSSVEEILSPGEVVFSPLSLGILAVSICVKLYMSFYNRRIGKKINSAAMRATAMDSLSDTVATTVVLLSMIVTRLTDLPNIDSWCGIVVALFILYAGYSAAKDTLSPLLGQAPDPEFVQEIHDIVMSHPEVVGIHDLVVHDYGPGRVMISLHGEVPANGDMLHLHDAIDLIERELQEKLGCEAVIHMDPVSTDDETVVSMRERLSAQVKELDEHLSIHDFRIVRGPTHTNLIFDVVVPPSFRMSDKEVMAAVEQMVESDWEGCFAVLKIDRAYA